MYMHGYKLLSLFIIGLFLNVDATQAQLLWNQYVPKNSKASFKVECTDALKYQSQDIETEVGPLTIESFQTKDPMDSTYIYSIVAMIYPEGFLSDENAEDDDMLSHMIEGSAQQMLGRVVYQSDISTDEVSAKLFRIAYQNDEKSIKGRLMRYEDVIYNVQIASLSENNLDNRIDRFLDSFMILRED